jgi:hypothetical protein
VAVDLDDGHALSHCRRGMLAGMVLDLTPDELLGIPFEEKR